MFFFVLKLLYKGTLPQNISILKTSLIGFNKFFFEIWHKLQFELFVGPWNYVSALCAEHSLHGSLQCVEQSLQCSHPCAEQSLKFAPHMDGSNADFAPHMEQRQSYRDQIIIKTAVFANCQTELFKTTIILGIDMTYVITFENKNILRGNTFKLSELKISHPWIKETNFGASLYY